MNEKSPKDSNSNKNIQLTDCLKAFKQSETLDEDNMWYCNKCKDHVQATKKLDLYKLPKYLVLVLKRFKKGSITKSRYSFSGFVERGGHKVKTEIEFAVVSRH